MVDQRLGVGIIGTGWGVRVQVPAFRSAGLEVRALAGSSAEKTSRIAQELGVPFASGNWRELLARDDIGLVSIVTPPALHREIAVAAFEAGKDVLCEKPTALNTAEAQAMAEAAHSHRDLFALIDHELRFLPVLQRARELIQGGAIGEIRHAQALFINSSRLDPQRPWNWWSDQAQGGGALGAVGSHVVDTLRFLVGEVEAARGYLGVHIASRPFEGDARPVSADDHTFFQLRHNGGVEADVVVSSVADNNVPNEVAITGSRGVLRLIDWRLYQIGRSVTELTPEPSVSFPEGISGPFPEGSVYLGHALRAALESNSCDPIAVGASFDDGLQIQRALDAIRRSHSQDGGWVVLSGVQ